METFRLSFRSPLHIGERGVGLEVTRTHLPADTLFSALCVAWRQLYGVNALCDDVLSWFTEIEGSEPFFLSSAFPYADKVELFPRPLVQSSNVQIDEEDHKAFKRVRFVSKRVFTAMVSKEALVFRKEDCVNKGVVWVHEEEKAALSAFRDDATDEIVLWKTAVVPRVTLDRITSASQIWHFGEVLFREGAGLWFAADFNDYEHGDELRFRFEACLRLLGDTGLGGERGSGHGLFSFQSGSLELPDVQNANAFVTLAPLCPKDTTELASLTGNGASYELMPRRGWVTSPEGSNLRRKMIWMFAEGSVLTGGANPRPGFLVNVKPDPCPHDVWRYGYAFPVGVKA